VPRKVLPRIAAVTPGEQPMTLRVRWDKGAESLIDLSGMIQSFRVYTPLRQSPELFRQMCVGEYGTDVVWTDEIDMAADTLWRLAQEQAGETMTADAFRRWRERKAYTLDQAARALGLSRRMVAYYEKGDRPIPRVVALPTRALHMASANSRSGRAWRRSRRRSYAGSPRADGRALSGCIPANPAKCRRGAESPRPT
jgi:DNA-binding XRE family transcriptional regulator